MACLFVPGICKPIKASGIYKYWPSQQVAVFYLQKQQIAALPVNASKLSPVQYRFFVQVQLRQKYYAP